MIYSPSSLKEEVLTSLKSSFYNGKYAAQPIAVEGTIIREPSIYGSNAYFSIEDVNKVQLNVKGPKLLARELQKGLFVQLSGTLNLNSRQNVIDYDVLFCATTLLNKKESREQQEVNDLVRELFDLGYFARKKSFPNLLEKPKCRVAIVTSGNNAANAFSDIEAIAREIPLYSLTLISVNLASSEDIARGITEAGKENFDILILTRGGGEQLDVFDERPVLDALFSVQAFTISAIGHARDKVLSDMVADYIARTPTDAGRYLAEKYASSLTQQEFSRLQQSNSQLVRSISDIHKLLDDSQNQLAYYTARLRQAEFRSRAYLGIAAVSILISLTLLIWK